MRSIWRHRQLTLQLAKREFANRHRGSLLGLLWMIVTPVCMLLVYTFVFSVIFKSRWSGAESGNHAEFAVILFCGLTVFAFFSETISRSPNLIVSNPSYVKKVIFPLEILPVATFLASLFQGLLTLLILYVADFILFGRLPWTAVFIPAVLAPLTLFTLGLSWLLASLGVFLRDLAHIVPLALTALMFLTPVFYPVSAVPGQVALLCELSPLAYAVEDARRVLIWGELPRFASLLLHMTIGLTCAATGYWWFNRTRKAFADVI
jgi:lipopolysaccharide transport system permease protein